MLPALRVVVSWPPAGGGGASVEDWRSTAAWACCRRLPSVTPVAVLFRFIRMAVLARHKEGEVLKLRRRPHVGWLMRGTAKTRSDPRAGDDKGKFTWAVPPSGSGFGQ